MADVDSLSGYLIPTSPTVTSEATPKSYIDNLVANSSTSRHSDQVSFGDWASPTERRNANFQAVMSNGFITMCGFLSNRTVSAVFSKVRIAVNSAATTSAATTPTLKIMTGTALTSLATVATATTPQSTYTSQGVKELTLSASVGFNVNTYVFAVWYIPASTWGTAPSLAGFQVSQLLMNPSTSARFAQYKSASSDQASPMDATSGWTTSTSGISQFPWWALVV